jgi:hypothetical protein
VNKDRESMVSESILGCVATGNSPFPSQLVVTWVEVEAFICLAWSIDGGGDGVGLILVVMMFLLVVMVIVMDDHEEEGEEDGCG